jgi:hypothetical protein
MAALEHKVLITVAGKLDDQNFHQSKVLAEVPKYGCYTFYYFPSVFVNNLGFPV